MNLTLVDVGHPYSTPCQVAFDLAGYASLDSAPQGECDLLRRFIRALGRSTAARRVASPCSPKRHVCIKMLYVFAVHSEQPLRFLDDHSPLLKSFPYLPTQFSFVPCTTSSKPKNHEARGSPRQPLPRKHSPGRLNQTVRYGLGLSQQLQGRATMW